MTTYEKLLALGYSKDTILNAIKGWNSRVRTFTITGSMAPDGYPLIGLSYTCDYRAEEEWGQRAIYKTLGIEPHYWQMKPDNKVFISKFQGIPSLIILAENWESFGSEEQAWGKNIETSRGVIEAYGTRDVSPEQKGKGHSLLNYYNEYYRYARSIVQGTPDDLRPQDWTKIAELKAIAEKLGIKGRLPTRKDKLIEFIQDSKEFLALATEPNVWPGWFHNGKALILRADRGIVADILNILYEASQAGFLACGGGKGAFSTGATFYDSRDVGPLLLAERLAVIEAQKLDVLVP